MGIPPEVIERLVRDPEQPIEALMTEVYCYGELPLVNAVFDEGHRVQHDDPERALACIRVIDRIQERTRPR